MITQAPELIRAASRLTQEDIEALVCVVEVSHPGLSKASVRNAIEALASAGRKLNGSDQPMPRYVDDPR